MWYWIFRDLGFIILKVFFRLKIEGRDNIPRKGNFIVVANHVSFLDPFIVGAAIPKKIYWIALRQFHFMLGLRWFMRRLKTLASGSSSKHAVDLLFHNKNVGLFPEGTRTRDGRIRPFRRGVALLALKTGRPILPCAIMGAYEAFPRSAKFPRLRPIRIRIGKPQYLMKMHHEIIDDIYMQECIHKLKNTIEEMTHG